MKLRYIVLSALLLIAYMSLGQTKISEHKYVSIGGIEQWVSISGNDTNNPVVLLVHGGPGSTMSYYKENVYAGWMKEYTIVHWDQRGSGKTFGINRPKEMNNDFYTNNLLSFEQMANDGIAVSEYVLNRLDKSKLILIGTSWGSILATQMAQKNPDLFHAYLGHAQFVNFTRNINNAYCEVFKLAKEKLDDQAVKKLNDLGAPPYQRAKDYGQLLNVVQRFEKEHSEPVPSKWRKIADEYDNNHDSKNRYDGDDYTFLNLVGDEYLGVPAMATHIDFDKTAVTFKLPVYLIQGENDVLCPKELTKPYFDKIRAPRKEFVIVSKAAHMVNEAIVKKQYEIVKALRVQN
ncbi:alpha/beta fold hydrolase [Maribacter sp.]|uniref:alpha/beta fold hydrolase n=1 Tax=Maribacter sp. TaxID=1897614 RepID=UPI0025BA0E9B|nr:alpha/beta hydrolase [Maribacter sp.]